MGEAQQGTLPATTPAEVEADRLWQRLVTLVIDSRVDWKRRVSETTGLPFTRVRALRRLANRPLTMSELASQLGCDAPATTLAVNDLQGRGLVTRTPHPTNGRMKIVSLTSEGRALLERGMALEDPAPASVRALSQRDLADLARVLDAITGE